MNSAYSYLHVLLTAKELSDQDNPRWLLVYSEFRGIIGIVDCTT